MATESIQSMLLQQAEHYPSVRIFEDPKTGAPRVGEIPSGTWVQSNGQSRGDFIHVLHERERLEGWVGQKNVTEFSGYALLGQAEGHSSVRVRSFPQSGAEIAGAIPSGKWVSWHKQQGGFIHVSSSEVPITGWIRKTNVTQYSIEKPAVLDISVEVAMISGSRAFGPHKVPASSTVHMLKAEISKEVDQPPCLLQLVWDTRVLQDTETFGSFGSSTMKLSLMLLNGMDAAEAQWKKWSEQECQHTGSDSAPWHRSEKGQVSVFDGGSWAFYEAILKFQAPGDFVKSTTEDFKPLDSEIREKVKGRCPDHPKFSSVSTRLDDVFKLIRDCGLSATARMEESGEWTVFSCKITIVVHNSERSMSFTFDTTSKECF